MEAGYIGNEGLTASELARRIAISDPAILTLNEMSGQFTDLRDPVPFIITKPPELFEETWIDPNEHLINYKKHEKTCAKNRKRRKKRKRK